LGIGTKEEVFQLFGKQPSLRDMLTCLDREGTILFAIPFNILPDRSSGPFALSGSIGVIYESTSLGVKLIS